jgi:hypothetical protein
MSKYLNYWWVTRPKRTLFSVPEVLAVFASNSLKKKWHGDTNEHRNFEDALEDNKIKRIGERRDHGGSGGRTYAAWLKSLGLVFAQKNTGDIMLTLAGEELLKNTSPVKILSNQIWKYQFPSAFSISPWVNVSPRFRIRPFIFLLKLLLDDRISSLSQEEIAKIVITQAENETDACYKDVVSKILNFRSSGDDSLPKNFLELYSPRSGKVNPQHPYSHLYDIANTIINWIEYTQICHRLEGKRGDLVILEGKKSEAQSIVENAHNIIDQADNEEIFQRKYGLDPYHQKDNRNFKNTPTVTKEIFNASLVRSAYLEKTAKTLVTSINTELIEEISESTGVDKKFVEDYLAANYPHGSIGSFMASYYEMAFQHREMATDFEEATTDIFSKVFNFRSIHLGQGGSKSVPDVLIISDSDGYQSIIDNKAYAEYSITGDHRNRMVHNYIENIQSYSSENLPIGFFTYIAGGFGSNIDSQILNISNESNVNGSGITVSTFINMINKAISSPYSHDKIRSIFSVNRQIRLEDI